MIKIWTHLISQWEAVVTQVVMVMRHDLSSVETPMDILLLLHIHNDNCISNIHVSGLALDKKIPLKVSKNGY